MQESSSLAAGAAGAIALQPEPGPLHFIDCNMAGNGFGDGQADFEHEQKMQKMKSECDSYTAQANETLRASKSAAEKSELDLRAQLTNLQETFAQLQDQFDTEVGPSGPAFVLKQEDIEAYTQNRSGGKFIKLSRLECPDLPHLKHWRQHDQ